MMDRKFLSTVLFILFGCFLPEAIRADDPATLQRLFSDYAAIARVAVKPSDRNPVLEFVGQFPEGSEAPRYEIANGVNNTAIPSQAAAYFVVGLQAFVDNSRMVAAWSFLEAAARNPRDPVFLNNAAFSALEYGLYAEAKRILYHVHAMAPEFVSAIVNRAAAMSGLGDHAGAGGEYLKALLKDPARGDYLALAALEYQRAGEIGTARLLAATGRETWPHDADFDSLFESFGPVPAAQSSQSCPHMTWAGSAAISAGVYDADLSSVVDAYAQVFDDAGAQFDTFFNDTIVPETGDITVDRLRCGDNAYASFHYCDDGTAQKFWCGCQWDIMRAHCELRKSIKEFGLGRKSDIRWYALENGAIAQAEAIIASNSASLDPLQLDLLGDCAEQHKYQTQRDLADSISEAARTVAEDASYVAEATSCEAELQYVGEYWVVDSGWSFSVEPELCLFVVCASYDLTTLTPAISFKRGVSVKLSHDPFTGDNVIATGIGINTTDLFGVGPKGLGGAIVFKYSEDRREVEPKISLGPIDVGYYMALERGWGTIRY